MGSADPFRLDSGLIGLINGSSGRMTGKQELTVENRRFHSERVGCEIKAKHETDNNQARDGQPPSVSLLRGK